jgi:hypothetical protein
MGVLNGSSLRVLWLGILVSTSAPAAGQVPPNSRYFSVEGYYYRDSTGNYRPYRVAGFASPPQTGSPARLIILPTIYVNETSTRFFNANGQLFQPDSTSVTRAEYITIEPKITNAVPTPVQAPAVGAILQGVKYDQSFAPPLMNTMGQPYIHDGLANTPPGVLHWPSYATTIMQYYSGYIGELQRQAGFAAVYGSYLPQQGNVSALRISLLIGGELVAERTIPGTSVSPNTIASISVQSPTIAQQNMIASGDYELQLTYEFRDVSTSSIQAEFDAFAVMDQFINEAQSATTRNSSSGVQILGIGSRRTKIKSALNQQIQSQHTEQNVEGTSIRMYDANDAMVKRFEDAFLPKIGLADVILGHRQAAAAARQQGNTRLAEIHEGYANALANSNELDAVNYELAAASLTAGDWRGFLAHGVRASSNNDRRVNEYRRVITNHEDIRRHRSWSELQQVTLQREATAIVRPPRFRQLPAYWGDCGAIPVQVNAFVAAGGAPPTLQPTDGVLITCVHQGSPAAEAGLYAGHIVTKVDNLRIRTLADWHRATRSYRPDQQATVKVFRHTYGMPTSEEASVRVRLRRGVPPPPGEEE